MNRVKLVPSLFLFVCACRFATPAPHTHPAEDSIKTFRSARIATVYTYGCRGDIGFTIQAADADAVDLFLRDEVRRLSRRQTGSGVKFSDGEVSVWSKGAEAVLQIDDSSYRCRQEPARAVRQDALMSGVQFLAAGLEDDWSLEVYDDRIVFTDEAEGRVIVPPSSPEQAHGATIYVSTSETHRLQIVIEPRECTNLINGERFDAAVEVNLDGDGYSGCGYVR